MGVFVVQLDMSINGQMRIHETGTSFVFQDILG